MEYAIQDRFWPQENLENSALGKSTEAKEREKTLEF
ncbi:MAG: hypothetical protein ACJAWC_002973 [Yoonia sp.]|jgi:hypothetical protein